MAEALLVKSGGGTDSSDLTATLSQVLSGYTAMTSDSNDDPRTGTMPNRGAVNQTLNAGGSYTIPQGYHNGSGKVTANSLASQTSGNASSAQILTGYNAWVNGSNINGNMPNRGNLDFNPSSSTSQSVSAGYYSGGTLSSANAYNAGYNAGKATFAGEIELLLNGSIGSNNATITYDLGKYAGYKAIFLAAYYPSTLTFSNPQNVTAEIQSNGQLDTACFTDIKSNSSFQIYKYGTGSVNAIMYGIK